MWLYLHLSRPISSGDNLGELTLSINTVLSGCCSTSCLHHSNVNISICIIWAPCAPCEYKHNLSSLWAMHGDMSDQSPWRVLLLNICHKRKASILWLHSQDLLKQALLEGVGLVVLNSQSWAELCLHYVYSCSGENNKKAKTCYQSY